MPDSLIKNKANFGTTPVFMTAISTILGAILFLRFGYAVANVGFFGVIAIIIIGHLVTVPTAMAVAEIATNRKVEGGGAYYIISRSFGLNIGAAIGIALYLSQAISVAFYVIAFAESFVPFAEYLIATYPQYVAGFEDILMDKRIIALVMMSLLTLLMLTKGANIGVKALNYVVGILFISLLFFFFGEPIEGHNFSDVDLIGTIPDSDSFFYVFTIIFPAFTGIAAGLGLSGDLKDPKKSIPKGTLLATAVGIIVYVIVALKLVLSAPLEDLDSDPLIMSSIAIWSPIIPIGLAGAAISSALGSIMVAPRTLQALGIDKIFPSDNTNSWLSKIKKNNEPFNAALISALIAFFFVFIGDINSVAEVISMFFMVTYGAICTISLLEHFSGDPSYRPTFRSRWYISLLGAVLSMWLMFQMNMPYAILSLVFMAIVYVYISRYNTRREGLVKLFRGVIFQLSRQMQIFIQKKDYNNVDQHWRPFAICVSNDSFRRRDAFDLMRWISHKYGFGTYMHYIEGYLSKESHEKAQDVMSRMVNMAEGSNSRVYLDTIISPSYTSAMAQVIQLASISGKGHNLIAFEYERREPANLNEVIKNYHLLTATHFDVCILGTSYRSYGYLKEIHIWISPEDRQDSTLEILLGYILLGHKDWKKAQIKIYAIYQEGTIEDQKEKLLVQIQEGRLPISPSNIQLIDNTKQRPKKEIINEFSSMADLTLIGFHSEDIEQGTELFEGYDDLGNILFVNSMNKKEMDPV